MTYIDGKGVNRGGKPNNALQPEGMIKERQYDPVRDTIPSRPIKTELTDTIPSRPISNKLTDTVIGLESTQTLLAYASDIVKPAAEPSTSTGTGLMNDVFRKLVETAYHSQVYIHTPIVTYNSQVHKPIVTYHSQVYIHAPIVTYNSQVRYICRL